MNLLQYQVVLANLDPSVGSELKKTRPCVIISPNELNSNLKTIIIAPITSISKSYPTRIEINRISLHGWIALDQIKTIDKSRIISILDQLSTKEYLAIKTVIKETFVD